MALIGEWAGKGDAEWRAELGYDRGLDRARAGMGYTRRFNKLQLTGFGESQAMGRSRHRSRSPSALGQSQWRLARVERKACEPRAGDRRRLDGR
jgi:hypothetical protein